MAHRKFNTLIIIAIGLLVAAIIGVAYIQNNAPAGEMVKGALWYELRTGCLMLAAVAVVIWILGFLKVQRKRGPRGKR